MVFRPLEGLEKVGLHVSLLVRQRTTCSPNSVEFNWDKKAMINPNEMNVNAGTDWTFHLSSLCGSQIETAEYIELFD